MKCRQLTCALLLSLACPPAAPVQADDWSLSRPAAPAGGASKRGGKRRTGTAARGATRGGDRSDVLMARYLTVLRKDPLQPFALERLLELHRNRDGGLTKLVASLTQELSERPDDAKLSVLLGEVQREAGDAAAARQSFARAAERAPGFAYRALARLERAEGRLEAAREALTRALEHASEATAKRDLRRALAEAALDVQDFEAAEKHYEALAADSRAGVYQLTELARALSQRGHHERAVSAYQKALARLRGDRRVVPPVLVELARAQIEGGDAEAALETLERARRATGASPGLRHQVDELLLDVHRRRGSLAALAEELAGGRDRGFEAQELLGRIYDELGDHERALDAFRRALAASPRHLDTRLRVIAILSRQGELSAVVEEYRALVSAAPREPRFVVELCQMLMETGRREQALRELAAAMRRLSRDAQLLRGAHELYARWGEHVLAERALARLSQIEPRDPSHLLLLGEHQLERGEAEQAVATWRRILQVSGDKARAHATLGETLLDHDMPVRALAEYDKAVKLRGDDLELLRGRAEALERVHRGKDAIEAWQKVYHLAGDDGGLLREARRRIVRLWASRGELRARSVEYERAFGYAFGRGDLSESAADPDLESGRFLAEVYQAMARGRHHGRPDARFLQAAEAVLERVIASAPGDLESLLSLERLRALRGDADGANQVLERLVEADPKNARAYLTRMANNALTLYRDEQAIAYAERSVALDPNDAAAHRRLGDLYRARQDVERAIQSYERAVELDDRLYPVYFRLSELQLSRGDPVAAERLLRRVVRSAPDDDLVRRAARAAIQLAQGTERLSDLEAELLPLSLGHPQRPVYRRLLVELYDAMTRPLIKAAGVADGATPDAELAAIGQRAIKPLLEALADPDPTQQRIAVEILGQVENPHAALPLLSLAESDAPMELRRRALEAAGAVADDALAPRFRALALGEERRLRDVAARALAGIGGPASRRALATLSAQGDGTVRGYALLGLARAGDSTALALARTALSEDRQPWVRGAAALSLGMLGARDAQPALISALRGERGPVAVAAAISLGVAGDEAAAPALANAAFADSERLQRAALLALHHLGRADVSAPPMPDLSSQPSLTGLLDAWLARLAGGEGGPSRFDDAIAKALGVALGGSRATIEAALRLVEGGRPELLPGGGPEQTRQRGLGLARGARASLRALVGHPEASIRASAVRVLGLLGGPDAADAAAGALDDPAEAVRSAALEALSRGAAAPAVSPRVARMVRAERSWWMRLRAVRALAVTGGPNAERTLIKALSSDGYAYVREAAAEALGRLGGAGAAKALRRAASGDSERQVRQAAARALEAIQP